MNYFFKPTLKNLSQGARLRYVKELRHLSKDDIAEYLGLGGERPERTISRYENNSRVPSKERLEELAQLYKVSIDAIKEYDYNNPIDTIYILMWFEEQFPYYEINLDNSNYKYTNYNSNVIKGIREWLKIKEKRENNEISCDEYIEWKLKLEMDLYNIN